MAQKRGGVVLDETAVNVTSVLTSQHEHAVVDENLDLDAATLAALGYKQEFKRFVAWYSHQLRDSALN